MAIGFCATVGGLHLEIRPLGGGQWAYAVLSVKEHRALNVTITFPTVNSLGCAKVLTNAYDSGPSRRFVTLGNSRDD